ncbi:hypothetical protein DASC09_008220 [Saccharomycopsis crataegensis]|uniref:Uncharacterized protein n=1 Tax=Saccharomycopsis crataegensis TaxID=43959 RepID=A0AAV5QFU6_9ASCO|nr:hypothetical protein DASC09_008220 [Saccharomycopsis crataegensis]
MQFTKKLLAPTITASIVLAAETTIYGALSSTTVLSITDYDATSTIEAGDDDDDDDDDVTTSYVDVTASSIYSVGTETTTTVGGSTFTSTIPTSSVAAYHSTIIVPTSSAVVNDTTSDAATAITTHTPVTTAALVSQISDGQIQAEYTTESLMDTVTETITSCSHGCSLSSTPPPEIESSSSSVTPNVTIESYSGIASSQRSLSKIFIACGIIFPVGVSLL